MGTRKNTCQLNKILKRKGAAAILQDALNSGRSGWRIKSTDGKLCIVDGKCLLTPASSERLSESVVVHISVLPTTEIRSKGDVRVLLDIVRITFTPEPDPSLPPFNLQTYPAIYNSSCVVRVKLKWPLH